PAPLEVTPAPTADPPPTREVTSAPATAEPPPPVAAASAPPPTASPAAAAALTGASTPRTPPAAALPLPHAWAAMEGGAAWRPSLAWAGSGAVTGGALLGERLWLGGRLTLATPRDLDGPDPAACLAERRLGLIATWSPAALRFAPSLGLTLENAWRRYALGAAPEVRHTVLVAGAQAGLALRRGAWSLEPALRLETDLDRTLLRLGGEEEDLPRVQVGLGLGLAWRSGQKR
ncbi:MAG: hypothetical protein ABIO70_12670, partial [Pseudomonadota bacterium]